MAEAEKTITIDGKSYSLDGMSAVAKANLVSLQATDLELKHLTNKTAIYQTARMAYLKALKDELEKGSPASD